MDPLTGNIQLNLRSATPIYTQIVEQVKQKVVSEGVKPGDKLPTVRALALELKVNFNTVARAYRLLDKANIISTQQGRGTFILDISPPRRSKKLRHQALKTLTRNFLEQALVMGCKPADIMHAVEDQIDNGMLPGKS